MAYTIDSTFNGSSFEEVTERTRKALADHGFGVLTEIDVAATMKKKLDVDMPSYLILGACNPSMAHQAIGIEPRIGAMLPCNVIIRETENGEICVSAVDPVASMQAVGNARLSEVAEDVRALLANVIIDI